ncbi:GEVED domain-containing protein [Flavobacterium caeni]|uniref:GEVED domain-containing protein n=1 Tax=Flavobacterium caeni TaxID=490189 RepID=UPI00148006CB|nr:GEVED domain-containing protein [Flavobacterium caeni]
MSLKTMFAALMGLAAWSGFAQVSSYTITGTGVGQTFTEINTGGGATGAFGTTANATLDNATIGARPIGFDFNFNGKVYTTCNVSFNGFITFGAMTPAQLTAMATDFTPISTTTSSYEGVIAAYARDLKGALTDVLYQVQGTPNTRTFTIQWIAYRNTQSSAAIRMQIILHESHPSNPNSGLVEIKYNANTAQTPAIGLTGQIGLRGENTTDFNNKFRSATGAWPATAGGVLARGTAANSTVITTFNANGSTISVPTLFTFIPPTCFAPKAVRATPVSISDTGATITWTAPLVAPASGYDYLVSPTAPTAMNYDTYGPAYPKDITPATGSVGAGITTTAVGSLMPSTLYYIYVRSNCGTPGGWSAAGSFTTLCPPITVLPHTENFNLATVGSVPPCMKRESGAGSAVWAVTNPTVPSWGFMDRHMRITVLGGNDNDATFFTEGYQLTGGTSYRLSYKYGASADFVTTEQSMSISYGLAPVAGAMTNLLVDYPSFKAGPYTNVINFTPPADGVYFIGFYDYTVAGNAATLVDDIDLRPSTCFAPVLNAVSGITSGSGFVSWTAAVPNPASGYEYFYSTTNTPPTSASTPMGGTAAGVTSFTLGGLSPSTTYYVWVRSSCGGGDYSNWSSLVSFTTDVGPAPPTCVPSGAGYFQDPNGITNVTFSNVNNTTGIEVNNYGDYTYFTGYGGQGTTMPFSVTYRTGFSYDTKIWIDWNDDGDFDDVAPFNELVYTGNSSASVPAVLTGTFNIPNSATLLGAHRMRIGGMDFGPAALTPCRNGSWQAYEDYTLYVTSPPPAINLNPYTGIICQGETSLVTLAPSSPAANYTSYTWTPSAGVTGNAASGWTFSPTATTIYELVGYNGATFHRATATVTITVKNTPSAVSITPSTLAVCQNATTLSPLTVSGGIVSGVAIYSENFNAPTAAGWTQQNFTTGSTNIPPTNDLAAWGLFPDGYNPFFGTVIHSNDNSQFAFTESDAPGGAADVHTELLSPAINLTGYTTATLNFYEFYMAFLTDVNDEFRAVDIMAADGTTLLATPLQNPGTANIGAANNFALATVDLTPYVGTTIRVRFRYEATYDWGYAIDNFVVTGSGPSSYTWSPITGLYNDAAGTVAYTGDARATVYPRPTVDTNYTVTATAFGCPVVSAPMTVTVTPINGGAMVVTSQTVCGGSAASDIVLTTGSVQGTILYWQYADDALFTVNLTNIPGSGGLMTLPSAMIGTITGPRYFRAVVNVAGCANAFSPTHAITIPTTTWTVGPGWSAGPPTASVQAVFNGNYTSTGNLTACSVQVIGGIVTINSGHTLTVQNEVNVSNTARLIFEDDASLVQVTNAANIGDITYKRNTTPMRMWDYTYWSSPVDGQILASFSPLTMADKYFWFNTTTYQWTAVSAPGITPMTPGRGYIIRAPQGFNSVPQVWPGSFGYDGVTHGGGVPNNGTIPVTVGHNSSTNNLDCIGNPYPSAISANLFMTDSQNAAALGAGGTTLYFWTHNTPVTASQYNYNNADYASYNYTGGVGTGAAATSPLPCVGCNFNVPNGNIAAGQAFMVKTVASGTIYFKNTMRLTGLNTQFFRMDDQEDPVELLQRSRLWLEFTNNDGAYKQTLVGYIENATNGIDEGFDGPLVEVGNPVSIYTMVDGQKLSIQGRAITFSEDDVIPVGYRSNIAGSFQINMPMIDGLFADQDVYLEDMMLGITHDLKQGPYPFTTEAGTFDNRFVIKFVNNLLAVERPTLNGNNVVVYQNDQTIFIETSQVKMKSVKIFDLRGRLIAEKDAVNEHKVAFNNLLAAQEVLLVQITSEDGAVVTKKIVY